MARKFLYAVAGLIVLALAALIVLTLWSRELTAFAFVPRAAFEPQLQLPPGSYEPREMWLARPDLPKGDDPSRLLPRGWKEPAGEPSIASVFFIHATGSFVRSRWNEPANSPDSAERDANFLRIMGSAFNRSPVWAPRYRQAVLGAFLTSAPEARRAVDVAYGDVLQAFDTFLAKQPADAPIVLAGHDQGALLLLRLLHDRVKGRPLARRLVAAYAIGWPVSARGDLPQTGLEACPAPDATPCVMSWTAFAEPADPSQMRDAMRNLAPFGGAIDTGPVLCTNPLTGDARPEAPANANHGTLVPDAYMREASIRPGAVSAKCDARGLLLIKGQPNLGNYVLPGNDYLFYDIALFWADLRADVARREAAWRLINGRAPIAKFW